MKTKRIELTGSPKPHFKTKNEFLNVVEPYGYIHGKITKRNNTCDILVTDDTSKSSNKMELAKELGVEIMSYEEIVELFEL